MILWLCIGVVVGAAFWPMFYYLGKRVAFDEATRMVQRNGRY